MGRLVLVGAAAACAVLLVRRVAHGCGRFDFEKMIERMPENAPPKWMFRNIRAIRKNTERILELIDAERAAPTERQARTAA